MAFLLQHKWGCLSHSDFCSDILNVHPLLGGHSLGGGCLVTLVHTSVILGGATLQGRLSMSDIFYSAVKSQVIALKEESG